MGSVLGKLVRETRRRRNATNARIFFFIRSFVAMVAVFIRSFVAIVCIHPFICGNGRCIHSFIRGDCLYSSVHLWRWSLYSFVHSWRLSVFIRAFVTMVAVFICAFVAMVSIHPFIRGNPKVSTLASLCQTFLLLFLLRAQIFLPIPSRIILCICPKFLLPIHPTWGGAIAHLDP